jgi:hypothetical protein
VERKAAPIGPNVNFGQEITVRNDGVSAVDVLFVIDDSGSMSQEQENLAVQIPALVRDLASPPDRDGDGNPDWNAAEQLRIGIATTDVGTGTASIPGSQCEPGGDDGALQGGVFTWEEGDDPDAFADSVRGVVQGLGITGCAFEQPLEAAARTIAHAPETGFPAADGLLAVIVVTDEEDCSVDDDGVFFSSAAEGTYNVHCTRYRDSLTPVDVLLDRVRGDRSESELVFAAIAGVPRDLTGEESPAEILALPGMQHNEVTLEPEGLIPEAVCEFHDDTGASLGRAQPARRLVEFGALVPDSVLTTICTDDFGPAIDRIATRIGSQIPGVCLVRALPTDATGQVPCEARVTMPEGSGCDARPGYQDLGLDEEGRTLCAMSQVGFDESGGFFYDPDRDGCAQLVIAEDARPPFGAKLDVECFVTILAPDGELCARDTQCESGYCDRISRVCAPLPESPDPALGG